MDETGLYFTMFPDRTGKRLTKRLTIALCCNADGSEKLPLLLIGKGEKPRGFTNTTAKEMNYLHTATTLMTREIFLQWITNVNIYFKEQQRKCVLLVDNAAVHTGYNVEELTNLEVVLFPPGTPPHLQPIAAGIVAAFKRRYRRRQIQQVLDQLDADADMSTAAKFDSIGVKQALTWCTESWDALPSTLLTSCWYETGLIFADNLNFVHESRSAEEHISEELAVMLSWLHAVNPLTVDELIYMPEENVIMDEPTDEDFCVPLETVKLVVPQMKSKALDLDGGLSVEELKERLKWIAKLLIYADEKGISADSVSGMRILQRDFRDQLNKRFEGINSNIVL
ncbi:tigger transposable element-derived protein 6-like [Plasmopara halstedii]|uniref:Tigger transposable element-derived protein 6-like n=1 Tax=Plasmopara halstedii TaxID=4781 RepID=A0A0P1B8N1_PLAHL|nr:tigger transposable element-derived protein 6-like [Plasmopara halstedii]CEG50361.1 tigger transposable element-derived protein 6-like [Plasmopara halstedii]|eukprot:XP_024586730.1 tigger transposable element-derived protein 6-like [Plasmopara halstedii]